MILEKSISFLKTLEKNNNREWFHAHKEIYNEAKVEFEEFVNHLIPLIADFDKTVMGTNAKDCIFRIFRDVRFSHDKRPYKTNFGAYINEGGKKSMNAGYYVHLDPNGYFAGGGIYKPPTPILTKIRTEIMENVDDYLSIIESKSFKETFGDVEGDRLKTTPKGFPKDFEYIHLIRLKSYIATTIFSEKEVLSENYLDKLVEVFKELKPLNDFLNYALKS